MNFLKLFRILLVSDPVTLLIIGGGLLAAKGQLDAGRAAEAQGKAAQAIANFNALQKEREAKSRLAAAELEESRVAKKEKQHKALLRVRGAKGGISISESSTLDILIEAAGEFATERALTLRKGLVESGFLKSQANLLRVEGKLSRDLGRSAKRSSQFQAAGTLLSSFGAAGAFAPTSATPLTTGQTAAFNAGAGPVSPAGAQSFFAERANPFNFLNRGF